MKKPSTKWVYLIFGVLIGFTVWIPYLHLTFSNLPIDVGFTSPNMIGWELKEGFLTKIKNQVYPISASQSLEFYILTYVLWIALMVLVFNLIKEYDAKLAGEQKK